MSSVMTSFENALWMARSLIGLSHHYERSLSDDLTFKICTDYTVLEICGLEILSYHLFLGRAGLGKWPGGQEVDGPALAQAWCEGRLAKLFLKNEGPKPGPPGVTRKPQALARMYEGPSNDAPSNKRMELIQVYDDDLFCRATSESFSEVSLHRHFREIIASMMFSNGDSEKPHIKNIEHVLDLVKNELMCLVGGASDLAKLRLERNFDFQIDLEDIFRVLRNQKGILQRLMTIAKTFHEVQVIKSRQKNMNSREEEEDDEYDVERDDSVFSPFAEFEERNSRNRIATTIKRALKKIGISVDSIIDHDDEQYLERQKILVEFTKNLSPEAYARFSEARRISFHDTLGYRFQRTRRPRLSFWLGNPPLGQNVEFVLAQVAKEVISVVVVNARNVQKQWRKDICMEAPLTAESYQEALRRNKVFRRYKKLLL
ncbi:unnamed protein product [Caenorhabditis auriculariae]|uniref:Uncharacterized protein n=1 Tax=Caenorhabditis auriculariae TaxID=2777116 RepID=A0A8S1HIN7_9PELO|nr:unnamed protein product [Caenorhabditis auriculariae]